MVQDKLVANGAASVVSHRAQRLAECYQRGVQLANGEKNHDYAHAMFAECVLRDPGNLQFVEAMIKNLRAKTPHGKKSRFKLLRGGSGALKKALKHKDWPTVLRTGIGLLASDPWDVTTLRAMAEACAAMHHNEVELVYLKQALDAEPKNVEVSRHCARSLGRMGQFDQAIACWHRVEKLRGKGEEAAQMISVLAEEKLKYPDGRPPIVQAKTAPAAEAAPEDTPREVVLSPQQKLEQAIAQDPKNTANYVELAAVLLASNRFDAAETLLSRAIATCGEQTILVQRLEQVRNLRDEEQRRLTEERSIEQAILNEPIRIPWLELSLGGAALLLVVQLVPSLRDAAWKMLDFREWTRIGWFVFNVLILAGLVAARFASDFVATVRRRRVRRRHRTVLYK
jgi:tetratricopeptide (TPR) repeat protein